LPIKKEEVPIFEYFDWGQRINFVPGVLWVEETNPRFRFFCPYPKEPGTWELTFNRGLIFHPDTEEETKDFESSDTEN